MSCYARFAMYRIDIILAMYIHPAFSLTCTTMIRIEIGGFENQMLGEIYRIDIIGVTYIHNILNATWNWDTDKTRVIITGALVQWSQLVGERHVVPNQTRHCPLILIPGMTPRKKSTMINCRVSILFFLSFTKVVYCINRSNVFVTSLESETAFHPR